MTTVIPSSVREAASCRLVAMHPRELTTEEGFRLIDQIAAFGDPPPLFVLTGGDPMRRPDLREPINGTLQGPSSAA